MTGELIDVSGDGYVADFYPNITTDKSFINSIQLMDNMIFSQASRVLTISFTAYSIRTDWWTTNIVMYEFGISSQVMRSIVRSYPFKPNLMETEEEKLIYKMDVVRIAITLIIVIAILITKV